MVTVMRNIAGPFVSPILYLALGCGTGIVLLRSSFAKALPSSFKTEGATYPKPSKWAWGAPLILLLLLYGLVLKGLFAEVRIDMDDPGVSGSDVMPALMFYVKRLWSGEFPYTPMQGTHWGYAVIPNYLPLQWLPYSLAEWLDMDYRWVPHIALCLAFVVHYIKTYKSEVPLAMKWLLWGLPVFYLFVWTLSNGDEFRNTGEALIAAYYILLVYSLASSKAIYVAIPLVCCLMSRYSLILWGPLMAVIYIRQHGWKNAFLLAGLVLLGILLVYGPFLMQDPFIFIKGYDYYTRAAGSEWKLQEWSSGLYPYHLEQGIGFAIYFFKWVHKDMIGQIDACRQFHMIISLSTVFVLGLIYLLKRKKIVHILLFLVGSFKVYMVVFYSFIQVPYVYLQIVPVFMNIPLVYLAIQQYFAAGKQGPYKNHFKASHK